MRLQNLISQANIYKVLVIMVLGTLFAFNAAAQNYVTNGAFNSDSSSWTYTVESGTGSGTYSSSVGRTANGSVRIQSTSPASSYSYWKQDVTLTAGHTYVLYAFMNGSGVAGGAGAGVECVHSTGTASSIHFNGTFGWTFTDTLFAPQTTSAQVRLCLGAASSQSSGSVYFDDVFLIDKNDNSILILVSASLYNNHLAVRQAVNTYRGDIQVMQNYYGHIATIGTGGNFQCTDEQQLKAVITFFYNGAGIEGLVFVGSDPELPTAMAYENQHCEIGATDLYYTDVSHTWPAPTVIAGRNVYSIYEQDGDDWILAGSKQIEDYHPELFYGRISAKMVKPGSPDGKSEAELIADEADVVVDYFDKIHNYRVNGENLDSVSLNRAAIFHDDVAAYTTKSTTLGDQYKNMDLMQSMIPNMEVWAHQVNTEIDAYKSVLGAGYRFLFLGNHGSADSGQVVRWQDNESFIDINYISDMEAESTPVKANYISLYSCTTGGYANNDPDEEQDVLGDAQKYYAGYMLFNNDYVLNVTAATIGGFYIDRPALFNSLKNEDPFGIAFKNYITDKQDSAENPHSECCLFGDPLIVLNDISPADKGPKILSDLRYIDARVNEQLSYTFTVGDPDDEASNIALALEADPEITSNYSYNAQTKTMTWTPGLYDVGKYFSFTATATDTTSNHTYTEEFSITVTQFDNWEMVYDGNGGVTDWTKTGNGTISDEEIRVPIFCDISCPRIRVDGNNVYLTQQVSNIVPNADYKVVLWNQARVYDSNGALIGSEDDQIHLWINEISTEIDIYDSDSAQSHNFSSGNNSSLTFTMRYVENEANRYLDAYTSFINLVNLTSAPPPAQITILYKNGEASSSTNTLRPLLQVQNTGTTTIDLADVTVRYWYTKDTTADQNFVCDYAQVGAGNVSGSFVDITPVTGADNYLLVGFSANAGTLDPDESSGEIQIRVYKDGWGSYTQTGDYSWIQNQSSYAENTNTTGYLDGELNYGTEP